MKKKNIHIFLFLLAHVCFTYAQQVTTDNSQQPNELIQNLVGDNCATASNVSSSINGSVNNIISYGAFDRGSSNFPLQNGIVLSTGNVTSVGNTFIGDNLSEGEIDWTTDSDIQDILGINQTLNATSIEFDFVSANNFVAFKYLFASDEYQQEYPCNFKDVFAILIKRAGTADPYINIALVPETISEISTNTIHPNINGFCEAQNEDFFQGYNLGHTNFNGNTTVLTTTSAIIPNETYHIKFVIADHIDERFDSAVFIEAEGFGNSIDLGPDQSICGNDLTLDANISNTAAIYTWFLGGNQITGENNPTLEVNQSGTYNVEISIPTTSGNCTLTDTIEIEIIPFQNADPIEDILICDEAPSDGLYDFDFPLLKNNEIFDALPSTNYVITYHLNQDDAQNNNNPIIGSYQNTEITESIFVRIESLSGDCLQIGNFNIIVNTSPNTLEISLYVCNDVIFSSSFSITNLSSLDFPVSNYEFNRTATYYLTEEDAINAENAISDLPNVSSQPTSFFARVEDDFNSCPSIVTLNLEYIIKANVGVDRFIYSQCLDPMYYESTNTPPFSYNYETLAISYNLDEIKAEIEAQYPEIWVQINLLIGGDPRIITTADPIFNVPISIRFVGEDCATPMFIELHKNILNTILKDETTISRCDDSSNDGVLDFDLTEIANELKEGYDLNLTFYETEEDRDNGSNPLDILMPYTGTDSAELFIASTYNDCSHSSKLILNIVESPVLIPQTASTCGDYNASENTTTIFLGQFDNLMFQDIPTLGVDYYITQEDAINEENILGDTYVVAGNSQTFYVKVVNRFTGCADITTLDINIQDSIELNQPSPIIACDDNLDGFEIVDLQSIIPTLVENPENYIITFHSRSTAAISGSNSINNPSTFNTESDEVFVRVALPGSDCFAVVSFEVIISPNPQLNDISDLINCVINPNSHIGFFFLNKDFEIINGQTGMQVLYFETEDDAINLIDEIDKTIGYQNTSNPQTIYVRLENETESSCYKIAPMQIEVTQAPIYNAPTDIFECDANSTGLVSTDLNEKLTEITADSTMDLNITFHLTPLNAAVGANAIPLNFTATSNPQLIYARVENVNSGCFETPTFYINTLSLPEVNYEQSFTACANNYNTALEWDLTLKEIEILDGRQYNVDFTYYKSQADLEGNTNPIANPEAYTNISNPETVFVKVRNASTECYASVPLELIINMPPEINRFETYDICENTDSYTNLLDINEVLLDNTYNVLVSYHTSLTDAEANENVLNTDYNYTNTIETIYARVEYSTTNCYAVYPFQLVINPLPIAYQPSNLIACDNDFDGVLSFDLSQQSSAVLNGQNPSEYTVSYYISEINANENTEQLNADYLAYNGEIIFVRIENNLTECYDTTQFSILVNPLPFDSIEDQVICLDNLPLVVSANTNNSADTYLWSTNATSAEIEIFETGTYSVIITNQFGCENTSTFNVTESESAIIDVVETIDFSDPNNITVTVNGIGDYLYQLNNGSFQVSNVFQNVPIGYNTITIRDQNGCAVVTREVLVIDAPKHMSPNEDGDFDTWHIVGVETLPGTIIHIFDRYGKLLKELRHNTSGWDGTYNGNKMPTGDYWYAATVIQNGKTFQVKGHFALRR